MAPWRQALPLATARGGFPLRTLGSMLLAGVILGLGSCTGDPDDLCRAVPPADPAAYEAEVTAARQSREKLFRTRDDSPVPPALRAEWSGLEYYPVDPSLRFEGPLVRKTSPNRFVMMSTTGEERPAQETGYFELDLPGGPVKLPVFELDDTPGNLFVPFMDATTGTETYPAGRYLDALPTQRGRYLLDFNLAYNPSCAYGGSFSCPITPESNRLRIPIRAGERGLGVHPR